jgi:DNA-binding NarL/FixJ family response regulator
MDIRMPEMNGIEATKKALTKYPGLIIIAISMFGEEEYLENMIKAGAKGFLLKDIDKNEIEYSIKQIHKGQNYYSPELLPYFTNKYINPRKETENIYSLTKRELEVLNLIAKGYTNNEIAKKLFISKRTVDGHKANIFDKTNSKNVVSLLIYAIKKGLIKL